MKKLIAILITLTITSSPLVALAQAGSITAESTATAVAALVRAADALGVPIQSEGIAQIAGATAGTKSQVIYNWVETFLRTTLKKALLDRLVDQIITYIQGGGKPKFVTDWRGFLEGAGQEAVGAFAQEVGLGFLCSPFSLQIQIGLLPVQKFSQQAQCTLNQIVKNIQSFYKDFRAGGWIAYGTAWEPQNNFFGASLLATLESERRQGLAQEAAYNEAISGNGFLSSKDKNGNIVTPGSTVGSLVAKAVGSDIDFLLSAEQLGEYAAAITNALINRVIVEGVAAVKTATSASSQQNAVTQYNNLIANNFATQKNSILSEIDQVVAAREQAGPVIDSMIQSLTKYKSDLQKIYDSFAIISKTVCLPSSSKPNDPTITVSNVKQAIQAEMALADNTILALQQEKLDDQAIINKLLAAKAEIEKLQSNDSGLAELQTISNELAPFLDVTAANKFLSDKTAQSASLTQNINGQLAKFNQELAQCQL